VSKLVISCRGNFSLLADDGSHANLQLLDLFCDVLVVLDESFLDALEEFLVASDSLEDDSLGFFKLSEEFAEVGS
jgi:hypothetical protein